MSTFGSPFTKSVGKTLSPRFGGGLTIPRTNLLAYYRGGTDTIGESTKLLSYQKIDLQVAQAIGETPTGTTYYMRADGTAATWAAATGPVTDATKCAGPALFNSDNIGYRPGNKIVMSDRGGEYPSLDTLYVSDGDPVFIVAAEGEFPIVTAGSSDTTAFAIDILPDWKVRGLTLRGGSTRTVYTKKQGRFVYCRFIDPDDDAARVVEIAEGHVVFDGCYLAGVPKSAGGIGIVSYNGGSYDIYNSVIIETFAGANAISPTVLLGFGQAATYNVSNCLIRGGNGAVASFMNVASMVNITNCIIGPSSFNFPYNRDLFVFAGTGHTLNESNNLYIPNPIDNSATDAWASINQAGYNGSGNLKTKSPRFITPTHGTGYLILGLDDQYDEYATQFADLVESYGGKITIWANYVTFNWLNATTMRSTGDATLIERTARMQALQAAGHDIGTQRWDDGMMTYDKVFDVVYTGAGATCTYTKTDTTITFESDTGDGDVEITVVDTDGVTDDNGDPVTDNGWTSIRDIVDALEATGVYTVNINNGLEGHSGLVQFAQASSLANVSAVDVTSATDVNFDHTKRQVNEFDDAYNWIENLVGVAPTSAAFCHNDRITADDSYVRTVYETARGGGDAETGDAFRKADLRAVDLFQIEFFGLGWMLTNLDQDVETATEERVKGFANWLGEYITTQPAVLAAFSHGESSLTIEQMTWFLDELTTNYPEIQLVSQRQFVDIVKNSGLWTYNETDDTWDREFDQSNLTFRLASDSPCLRAGTVPYSDGDGDQYDIEGYKIWDDTYDEPDGYMLHGWHIGPYSKEAAGLYYHATINSGTGWADWELKMPPAVAAALGDEVIDATDRAAMTGDKAFFSTRKGLAVYSEDLTGADLSRADRYFGTGD